MVVQPSPTDSDELLRPTDQQDVTPAMIAAGREVIESRWLEFIGVSGFHLWDTVLREVWMAMSEAQH